MFLSELPLADLAGRLRDQSLIFRTGPFVVQVGTDVINILQGIKTLYADFPVIENNCFADFRVSFRNSPRFRSVRPRVIFSFDGDTPFNPLPVTQGVAMFEWCLNWCITSCMNHYLIIHAAAVERNGCAAILPGAPGAGKSTLCAALVSRGWRLLTDELVLIPPQTNCVIPLARPIALKNVSIDVIHKWAPTAVFGPESNDTLKGKVAHVQPPHQSVLRMNEPAVPAWVVFPTYSSYGGAIARPVSKGRALIRCAASAFNYTILGAKGFGIMATLMEGAECYDFQYSDLKDAVSWFETLQSTITEIGRNAVSR